MSIQHLSVPLKHCVLCLFLFALGATAASAQLLNPDSVTLAIAPEYNEVSRAHRFWFGENYRALWATPVQMRVFHLSQEKGGMKILKKGGGQQTKSLRLQDAAGNEWVLRTVQKDPGLALPENLRATVAKAIVQDQISASHPFASLVVPPLAKALNVPHANPEIVYLPDDTALGEYRKDFANKVYLFEEREPLTVMDTDNTEKVLDKLEDDNSNRVDQRLVLRARLLDLVIGDWDRHADQWRWIEIKDEIGTLYRPVPRDRDQVFFVNTGVIPSIASRKWIMPKFQGYDKKIRDVRGLNFNARFFDRLFLQSLDEEAWREEIGLVQRTLTDALIYRAVRHMPSSIYALSGDKIARTMIARRDNLENVAIDYYRFLAKTVDIPISDKREHVAINYTQTDGSVSVTVHDLKKNDSNGRLVYQRTFHPDVNEEIRIYGRGGGDIFSVAGSERSPIKVRLIGGGGKDDFRVEEGFRNRGRLLLYDRSNKENTFPKASLATIKASADTKVNDYEPNTYEYDILMPQVTAGYNLDDGVLLGAGFLYTKHGFRKEPFAARHRLMVGGALATSAFFFDYSGEFTNTIGKSNLIVDVNGKAPNNTSNFFGLGNETEYVEVGDKPIRFYRTRYDLITSQVRLHRSLGEHFSINGGVAAQYYSNDTNENKGRFITSYQEEHPSEAIFSQKLFTGLVAGLEYDTRNNSLLPSGGMHWSTTLTGMQQLDNKREAYGQVQSAFSFYLPLGSSGNFVIANRLGGGATVGEPNFYQLLYLGGNNNLRGFRNYRFAGKHMLYHNLELRMKLFDFSSYLFPGTVGLLGFNDVGRIWTRGEDSDKWHDGFGVGLYLIPAKLVLVQGVIGISEEDVLPHVSVGFRF